MASIVEHPSGFGSFVDGPTRGVVRGAACVAIATGLACAVCAGLFGPSAAPRALQVAALVALGATSATTVVWRRQRLAHDLHPLWSLDFALGLAAIVGLHASLRFAGPLAQGLHPLTYALAAYLVISSRRSVAAALAASAIAIEVGTFILHPTPALGASDGAHLALRIAFLLTFPALYVAFQRVGAIRDDRELRHVAAEERRELARRSRELRLDGIASGVHELAPSRESLVAAAVDACEKASYHALSLIKHGLRARTAAIFWLDSAGTSLTVRELVSDSDAVVEGKILAGGGVLGGIVSRRSPLRINDLRPGFRGITYYRSHEQVSAFLGVPIIEEGRLRGVLCVDRADGASFDAQDERMLTEATDQIVRTIQNERLFISTERTRIEVGRFFDASRALAGATGLAKVYEVALEKVASIATFDIAAITVWDETNGEHTVAKASGGKLEQLEGVRFADNNGLVSMVTRMRHYLPFGGEHHDGHSYVFGPDTRLKAYRSLLVLPLVAQDHVIGTFVLGKMRKGAFAQERREMLEVITNQVAVAIENAQSYARMEQLATVDGLTNLLNRRTFIERCNQGLARSVRAEKAATMILTDIDFFKKVNDTYGHPVGDEVLRQVAKAFQATLRRTDIIGRYGGEEFIILLEDTDLEGGMQMAERLRLAVEELRFDTDKGPFSVTISLGLSSHPSDTTSQSDLIEFADQALYACKQGGRNCAKAYRKA